MSLGVAAAAAATAGLDASAASSSATQTDFVVPVVHNGALPGLTREKGVLGVEAKSNVEVDLLGAKNLAALDVEELPLELRESCAGTLVRFCWRRLFLRD
jgi:hypothetical protein